MAFMQAQGNIEAEEFARTFNCGIGMAIIVAEDAADKVTEKLTAAGETVLPIGRIAKGEKGCTVSGSAGTWSARREWTATHRG
jgi:phosphoribosylformylglycinamidine cyclo-ligase